MIELYIYDIDNLIAGSSLDSIVLDHLKNYKGEKLNVSTSNYQRLINYLEKNNYNKNISFVDECPILDDLFLSMSHSKYYYGFVISDKPIGLDIEELINDKYIDGFKRKLEVNTNDINELTLEFTKREAMGKLLGVGLTNDVLKSKCDKYYSFMLDNTVITLVYEYNNDIVVYINDRKR